MTHYAVTRERGPAWNPARPMREQEQWTEHAAFMNALAADGFVLLGGPLAEGVQFLLIINADDVAAVERRLADDPWAPMELLRIARVERWEILLGDAEIRKRG